MYMIITYILTVHGTSIDVVLIVILTIEGDQVCI